MTRTLNKKNRPKQLKQHERVMDKNDFIVSKTDIKGNIIYCNRIFVNMSGYTLDELLGANHNLIRHPDMPQAAFKLVWESIKKGEEFFGFVKNLCKDGSYYWVYAYITADYDASKRIIGYTSFRRRPNMQAVKEVEKLYNKLLEVERQSGLDASYKALEDILKESGMSYAEFILNLQNGVAA